MEGSRNGPRSEAREILSLLTLMVMKVVTVELLGEERGLLPGVLAAAWLEEDGGVVAALLLVLLCLELFVV